MIEMLKRGGNDWRALALFGFFCVPTPIGEIMGDRGAALGFVASM
jgi:hypothetical protein